MINQCVITVGITLVSLPTQNVTIGGIMTEAETFRICKFRRSQIGIDELRDDCLKVLEVRGIIPRTLQINFSHVVTNERQNTGFPAMKRGPILAECPTRW